MIEFRDTFLFEHLLQTTGLAAIYKKIFFAVFGNCPSTSTVAGSYTGGTAHLISVGQMKGLGQFKGDHSYITGSATGIDTCGSSIGHAITNI